MSDSGRERTCWETPAGTPGRRTSAAPQGQPIRPNLPTHHRFCYDQPEPPQGIRLSAVNPRCGSPCAPGGYHDQNHDGSADHHPGGRRPSGGLRVDHGRERATSRSPIPAGPHGAAAIFNHPGRIAWWEGPPFGGGQWHAECRGDAKALNAVLADFARLDVKTKRIVVHDGTGHSFWLAPNREPEKLAAAKIDWVFMVWQPASWEHLRKLPADLNPTDPGDTGPPVADRRLHRRHPTGPT